MVKLKWTGQPGVIIRRFNPRIDLRFKDENDIKEVDEEIADFLVNSEQFKGNFEVVED